MADLPKPDVTATPEQGPDASGKHFIDVTIGREGKTKTYHGTGHSPSDVVVDVVKQVISDPLTAEWLPSRRDEEGGAKH